MSLESKQLVNLSKIYNEAVYGKSPEQIEAAKRKKDNLAGAPLTVTNADKKANTKAYQNYKAGVKGYKAADHLKNEEFVDEKVATGPRLGEPREKGATHMNAGEQGKISKRTKDWMDKKGQPGAPGGDAMKEREAEHRARRGVKKEAFVNWRQDLKEIPDYDQIPVDAKKINAKVEEKNVKNKVKINPEMKEGVVNEGEGHGVSLRGLHNDRARLKDSEVGSAREKELKTRIKDKETQMQQVQTKRWNPKTKKLEKNLGSRPHVSPEAQRNEEVEIISEKEVKVKDTRRTVDAIRAYDKSKDASRDADWDTEHGEKEKGDIEKKYAKKERGEIDKDDPNWKKKKYHTGMHGESYEATKTKEVMGALKKRDLKKDVKKKIAADIVKKKGDTSKSDDRYAYEDEVWDKVADMLTELGKLNDVQFRVEGYQRNPEKGEKQDRKYEKVRGERTPMPPRGNKRREDFERWYAANVR